MTKQEILKYTEKERYSLEDLRIIFAYLRGENGCPWDRAQTHESIRSNLIEETYEVAEAIDKNDKKLMREELGDLFLQILFHTSFEEDAGVFTLEDVFSDIAEKLVRRHPHVFGEEIAEDADGALNAWDKAKAVEKKDRKTVADSMNSVPPSLPALMRASKVIGKAKKDGYCIESIASSAEGAFQSLQELYKSCEDHKDEEFGAAAAEAIFGILAMSRKYDIDVEDKLNKKTDSFISAYDKN